MGEATEKEACGNVELVNPGGMNSDDSEAQQVMVVDESRDTNGLQEKIEQIKEIFRVEENEDFPELMEGMDFENTFGIDFQDLEFGPEEMLMDELEQIVKGNYENTPKPSTTSLAPPNEGVNGKVELLNNLEDHDDTQNSVTVRPENVVQKVSDTFDSSINNVVIGEIQNERESNEHSSSKINTLDVEPIIQRKAMETSVFSGGAEDSFTPITEVEEFEVPEHISQKVPEVHGRSLDKDMVTDASKPSENKDKSLSQKANVLEVEHEMQLKDNELEMVRPRNEVNSPNYMNDGDMEEGEISDDDGMDERSTDMPLHDTVRSEENKVNEVQIFKDVIDQKEHTGKEAIGNEFDSNFFLMSNADKVQNPRGVELRERTTKPIGILGVVQGKTREAIKADDYDPLLESRRIEEKDSEIGRGIGIQEACTNNQAWHEKISEDNEAGSCGTTSEDKVSF